MCVTSHPGFTPHLNSWVLYIFPDPESELETPAKARREKQTSEHRASVCFFYLLIDYNSFESSGT